jgi:hypothetical protein
MYIHGLDLSGVPGSKISGLTSGSGLPSRDNFSDTSTPIPFSSGRSPSANVSL